MSDGDKGNARESFFVGRLESLRGLAALSVAIYHSAAMYSVPDTQWAGGLFLRIIGNGGGGIFLFFVLSGYVLTLSLRRSFARGSVLVETGVFYIRRAFRLMPLLMISILLGYAIMNLALVPPDAPLTAFARATIAPIPDIRDFIKDLLLLSFHSNPLAWTLRVELAWSIFLPVLFLLHERAGPIGRVMIFLALYAMMFLTQPGANFLYFGSAFYIGMWLTTAPRPFDCFTVVTVGAAMTFFGQLWGPDSFQHSMHLFGTSLILWGTIHAREVGFFKFLESGIARSLGRISYSFYLFHFLILALCVYFLTRVAPAVGGLYANVALILGSVALTLVVARFAYRQIEQRSMSAGVQVGLRFREKTVALLA